jgi:hypothetical protein
VQAVREVPLDTEAAGGRDSPESFLQMITEVDDLGIGVRLPRPEGIEYPPRPAPSETAFEVDEEISPQAPVEKALDPEALHPAVHVKTPYLVVTVADGGFPLFIGRDAGIVKKGSVEDVGYVEEKPVDAAMQEDIIHPDAGLDIEGALLSLDERFFEPGRIRSFNDDIADVPGDAKIFNDRLDEGPFFLHLEFAFKAVKLKKESFRFHPFRVAAGGEGCCLEILAEVLASPFRLIAFRVDITQVIEGILIGGRVPGDELVQALELEVELLLVLRRDRGVVDGLFVVALDDLDRREDLSRVLVYLEARSQRGDIFILLEEFVHPFLTGLEVGIIHGAGVLLNCGFRFLLRCRPGRAEGAGDEEHGNGEKENASEENRLFATIP